ncbi:unnamed protein product [Cunninghamella blakesleeana]
MLYLIKFLPFTNGVFGQLSPRGWAGCSLVQSTIYCYGGFSAYNRNGYYNNALSEHISLDLSTFNDFSDFQYSQVQWQTVKQSTQVFQESKARVASASILSKNAYLIYGGFISANNPNSLAIPFQAFDTSNSAWINLPLSPGNKYRTDSTLVNIGNDTIWIWGGSLNSTGTYSQNVVNVFDYKSSQWAGQFFYNFPMRQTHTATMAGNGIIYVLGGGSLKNATGLPFAYANFNDVLTFDTQSTQWNSISGTGDQPSQRDSHSTVQIPNTTYLLTYGGAKNEPNGLKAVDDSYVLFNFVNNSFTIVNLTSQNESNKRYGHFATMYQSNLLILVFGFVDGNSGADSFRILNVTDILNPVWFSNNNQSEISGVAASGLSTGQMVGIIIGVIAVSLIAAISGWFFFIRYKRRQKKEEFILEQEDPRKNFGNNEYDLHDVATNGMDDHDINGLTDNQSSTKVGTIPYGKLYESSHDYDHNKLTPLSDQHHHQRIKPFEENTN